MRNQLNKYLFGSTMKRIIIVSSIIIAISIALANYSEQTSIISNSEDSVKVLKPEFYHPDENKLISTIFSRYHYKKIKLNDSLSSVIFDRYLKSLDFSKSYFLKSDIDKFEQYRNKLDDFFLDGQLNPAYEIFNTFRDRVSERMNYINGLLDEEFDFSINEEFEVDRSNSPWPSTKDEANEIWRKRVKNDALNLKLSGKEWKAISETLKKRYENFQRNINQYKSEDVFQVLMNSYSEVIDPHTNYLSPITSENFKINMSLSLEGIGAQLQSEDEYTKVAEIVPGGPAFKSNLLHRNDRIIGVAQGKDGEMVDVIGWRLTDVVQLIRGDKGTVVRLQILAASDGVNPTPKEIQLVRDKIKLEEQAAKKDVIEIINNDKPFKLGIIDVPAFYNDFEAQQRGEKDFKSTTRDVKKLIEELKKEKVDGIIIDLRNNGGGSLSEAIEMTGLFIKDGPVVQVRNADGSVEVGDDPDPSIVYNGPLAVIVNRFSASASEIFAGAIQDYERGIILGDQTFGKGTVQNLIDLNRLMSGMDNNLGQIKLTIAKYYRINGGSTQHRGVIPDIEFPSTIDHQEYGESSEPSALPYDKIESTSYEKYNNLGSVIPILRDLHKKRIQSNIEFDYLNADIEEYKTEKEKKFISLNEEIRKKEKEVEDEREFQRENERRKNKGLELLQKGETGSEKVEVEDPLLHESAYILSDLILHSIG
jgi:carboxyl-terminal processing protease